MAIYAIGDVQGCFDELEQLLAKIDFNKHIDQLWFAGDIINRGNQSLAVMRFIKNLGEAAITVLGNHDLHFLAVANKIDKIKNKDTFQDVLEAPDAAELIEWLRHRPLLHYDEKLSYVITHAGLPPQWDLQQAIHYAAEVEAVLRSADYHTFLLNMYGNVPLKLSSTLNQWEKLRVITNYFTRMRYVDLEGQLELSYKGPVGGQPANYFPWFLVPGRLGNTIKILFGHWASLKGKTDMPNVIGLDTGCCWGNCLTAFRLEDQRIFSVDCKGV